MDTAAYRDLIAEFVATGRAVIAQLLATHVDDGTGHCKVCPGGPQAGRARFPCRLRELAEEAEEAWFGRPAVSTAGARSAWEPSTGRRARLQRVRAG
jgi:hypothetical protein